MESTIRIRLGPIFWLACIIGTGLLTASVANAEKPIQHDAEHYVLLHQYAKQWAAEDKELDKQLEKIRKKNGGKRPNIVYILLDDMGFGEYGIPTLNKIRGGRTPNVDKLAAEGATFTRMYAENICTPTPSCIYDRTIGGAYRDGSYQGHTSGRRRVEWQRGHDC